MSLIGSPGRMSSRISFSLIRWYAWDANDVAGATSSRRSCVWTVILPSLLASLPAFDILPLSKDTLWQHIDILVTYQLF